MLCKGCSHSSFLPFKNKFFLSLSLAVPEETCCCCLATPHSTAPTLATFRMNEFILSNLSGSSSIFSPSHPPIVNTLLKERAQTVNDGRIHRPSQRWRSIKILKGHSLPSGIFSLHQLTRALKSAFKTTYVWIDGMHMTVSIQMNSSLDLVPIFGRWLFRSTFFFLVYWPKCILISAEKIC